MKIYRIRRKSDGLYLAAGGRATKKGKIWTGLGAIKNAIHNMMYHPSRATDRKTAYSKWFAEHDILEFDVSSGGNIASVVAEDLI